MPRTKTRTTAKAKSTTALSTQKVTANAEQKGLTLVVNSKPPKYRIGDELFYSLKVAQEFIDNYEVVTDSEVVDVIASDIEMTVEDSNNLVSEEVEEVVDSDLVQKLVPDSEEFVVTVSDELADSEVANTNGDEKNEEPLVVQVDEEEHIPVSELNTDSVDGLSEQELSLESRESNVEDQGILIRDAAVRLGLSDEELRNLLKGVCPPLADRISMAIFYHIADSLRAKIKSEQRSEESDNGSTLTVGSHGELSDEAKDFDESHLQLNINLHSQTLNLNKIAKTLALVSADEAVEDFRKIYTHRLNHGINQITSEVAQQTIEAIDQLRARDNRDFLVGLGKGDSLESQEVQRKVEEVMNLI